MFRVLYVRGHRQLQAACSWQTQLSCLVGNRTVQSSTVMDVGARYGSENGVLSVLLGEPAVGI
jgi:biotin transporter BioY